MTYTGTQGPGTCPTSISVPSTAGILVDTSGPTVSSVTAPADGTYYIDQSMVFTVTMSEASTVSGIPRLTLNIGGLTRYATYTSGSGTTALLFNYTVQSTDVDANGIGMTAAIDLNGGSLQDSSGNNATLTFVAPNTTNVDTNGNVPYVTAVTPPSNGSYTVGDVLDFVFTYSEAVTVTGVPTITATIGATARTVSYFSGSGSTQLTFRYVIQTGETDADGVTTGSTFGMGGATIRRTATVVNAINGFVMPSLTAVLVVDDRPYISSFQFTNGTSYIDDSVTFTALFNEPVTITGTPQLPITLDTGGIVYANYVSGSGTSNIVFTYTVVAGVADTNGVIITTPLNLNSGTIKNASNLDANLTFTNVTLSNVRVDGIVPTIVSITPSADDSYLTGENIDFAVLFDSTVVATTTASIKLAITVGATAREANYVSGSGTNTLNFRYTVDPADLDTDGIAITALTLAGAATIKDVATVGNDADLTFVAPNTSGIWVNVTTPTIDSITPPADSTYLATQNLDFTFNYSEAVTVTGTPRIELTIGAATVYATYVSGSGTANLLFRHTVTTGAYDANGIAIGANVDNNGGTIVSTSFATSADTATPATTLTGVLVDARLTVSSVTLPADGTYTTSSPSMDFLVQWTGTVQVTGTPRISITAGTQTVYATYVSGDNTDTLTFRYTIGATDIDLDSLALASNSVGLNGGTITDGTNDVNLDMGAQDLTGIIVNFTSMTAWWDVTDSATVTTTVCGLDDCISQISDKSGSGINAVSANPNQAIYDSTTGLGTAASEAAQFDGTNDRMTSATLNPTRSVFIVFRTESGVMTDQDLFQRSDAAVRVRVVSNGNLSLVVTGYYTLNGSALSGLASSFAAGFVSNTEYILGVKYNGGYNINAPELGNGNFGGAIAEVLIYNNDLSAAQMAALSAYLNLKHGIY